MGDIDFVNMFMSDGEGLICSWAMGKGLDNNIIIGM
jgi:hypothetical protein